MSEGFVTARGTMAVEHGATGTATVPTRNLEGLVEQAVDRSTQWLLNAQYRGRCWWGELEADCTLNSDYIVFHYAIGDAKSPKIPKLANHVRRNQCADGGWSIFPGGSGEINATVKAYFALKLVGDDRDAPHMRRARERVLALGGLETTNSYERFHLALMGAIDWNLAPAVP